MHTRLAALALTALLLGACASSSSSGPDLGTPAPAFAAAVDSDGREVSLAALEGQVVIMDFWAVW